MSKKKLGPIGKLAGLRTGAKFENPEDSTKRTPFGKAIGLGPSFEIPKEYEERRRQLERGKFKYLNSLDMGELKAQGLAFKDFIFELHAVQETFEHVQELSSQGFLNKDPENIEGRDATLEDVMNRFNSQVEKWEYERDALKEDKISDDDERIIRALSELKKAKKDSKFVKELIDELIREGCITHKDALKFIKQTIQTDIAEFEVRRIIFLHKSDKL